MLSLTSEIKMTIGVASSAPLPFRASAAELRESVEVNNMAKLSELKKYLDYEFSSGCSTGQDYKTFQTKYINYLRTICRENNWQLVGILRGHYEFAVFVKNTDNKYVYISIDDVRYCPNKWFNNILIRKAKNEEDYTGGSNNYYSLPVLQFAIHQLLKGA